MEERRAKRPKIMRGEDDYVPGNIIEIELHNFMTFNQLTCKPGSRLNLVIGPNGSGKSSLVCAIALCLGGEPQLLGRANSVGAFVKRGEESGYVKISLKGDTKDEQITILRKIDTRNKSEWMFNGKVVPRREVIEVIQRFNIQVDNLTQFLPQDRVCEFAKLTPIQLLLETEKAVGDPQLPVKHQALIDRSHKLKQLERAVDINGETLSQLKALNAELERDVERVRQREELLAKVELMKKKLPWLKYDMKKSEYMLLKKKMAEAKAKFHEATKTLHELKEPIEKQKKEKAVVDATCKQFRNLMNENAKLCSNVLEKEDLAAAHVRAKRNEMDQLRNQEELRQQKMLKAKEDLVSAQMELQNLPLHEPPKEELERLKSQILELQFNINQKKNEKSEKDRLLAQKRQSLRQCLDRLKDMENKNNKLLGALRNTGADKIYDAYSWVQQHRHELNNDVYGPVLLEVNVANQSHAAYLEGHVPSYIWKAFITQDSRDRDYLVKNLGPFDVPVLNYLSESASQNYSCYISEEMKAVGINSRLDQIIDAPAAVKDVMTSQFGLANSYIGSRETDKRADEVAKLGVLDFWTPDNHYRWSASRYGGHVSASVEPVHQSRLLLCNVDTGEIELLRSRKDEMEESVASIEESVKAIQSKQKLLEEEAAKLHREREDIVHVAQQEKGKRRQLESLVNQRKRKLESFEEEDDLDTSLAKLTDQLIKSNNERYRYAIKFKNLLLEAVSHKRSYAEKHMTSVEMDAKIQESEINIKAQERSAEQASTHLEYCKKEVENSQQQLAAVKKHAEFIAIITPELEREFLEMPTTIEELEAAIQDNIAQANSILFLNQNVLEEYEHRQQQIRSLAMKLETDRDELSECLKEIDTLKESWLPTLRRLVSQINETFGRNFQDMAVAGEVSLDEHGMDFDKFGILIKVKFRQSGQLQVLSAHHQSGGERSVSTILYLVSLQDLTNCPFRVVDEINQGMDPINERKMFQQLVRAASQPNTPQCFLLTPKLLADLEYSEACSVLNIMNGPWIQQSSKAWSSGDSWASIIGLAGETQC